MAISANKHNFGTAPVFFTAISTILGAILFLRFGYAVGTLGFIGTLGIIIIGHLVTIPTALAISEIATNQKVEGGGEYFIISRSFGLNIGAVIGTALYLSQAISIAFYVIAFTEAFSPFFDYLASKEIWFPRQFISVPVMLLLSYIMLKKGANIGIKVLYVVVSVILLSLLLFFIGKTGYTESYESGIFSFRQGNIKDSFFIVFAIIFPAFTGMTAGIGLSGDLKNPARSIPLGSITATIAGMIVYIFIAYKLAISASSEDLVGNQLIMSKIALLGPLVIPLGLAASTISSAIGSIMIAPRTLQAMAADKSLPVASLNKTLAKGRGISNEPYNATLLTSIIALFFVLKGEINFVAQIISMFFMLTYGSICLISFLYHFGADPSYRPVFRSRWYISLTGFIFCIWLMFKMSPTYAFTAILLMVLFYMLVSYKHKNRQGMEAIIEGAIFQLNRHLQVFMQKKKGSDKKRWRPSAICFSQRSFENDKALQLLEWISYNHGFGTYIHLIENYFSKTSNSDADEVLQRLLDMSGKNSNVFIDTLISPSYTSAISQVIQLPGVSGMANNMIVFEFDKEKRDNVQRITENIALAKAAKLDVCLLAATERRIIYKNGIHVWIRSTDFENANLMILLSYIIMGHPVWRTAKINIFEITHSSELKNSKEKLLNIIQSGRLPISPANIEIIELNENVSVKNIISEKSKNSALTVIGFREEMLSRNKDIFFGYEELNDILFVNASELKEIS